MHPLSLVIDPFSRVSSDMKSSDAIQAGNPIQYGDLFLKLEISET